MIIIILEFCHSDIIQILGWRVHLQTRTYIADNLLFRGIEPLIVLDRGNKQIEKKDKFVETNWNIWIHKLFKENLDKKLTNQIKKFENDYPHLLFIHF